MLSSMLETDVSVTPDPRLIGSLWILNGSIIASERPLNLCGSP